MAKLLIIDDDEISARFFGEILASMGHTVTAIDNPGDALGTIAQDLPDLILMDLEMPDIDGADATRQIKQNPITENIPVIILTAHAEAQAFDDISMAGADGFLNKQSDRETIETVVARALNGT